MRNIQFGDGDVTTLILIKDDAVITTELTKYYVNPLLDRGLIKGEIAALGLLYENNKIKADLGKNYLRMLLPKLAKLAKLKRIIVADTNYFKWLTKQTKVTNCYGETFKGQLEGFTEYDIVIVPNHKSLFYNPANHELIDEGITAITGFKKPGIIHSAEYLHTPEEASKFFMKLFKYPALTVDIETTGLNLGIEILSIAFAWNKHNGGVFYLRDTGTEYLKGFFESYEGDLIFHNALFDCKHLIYNLFMRQEDDFEGMHKGCTVFANVEDSLIYTYLAKNSTAEVKLDLKSNSLEFAGNYGLDIRNADALPVKDLLEYNLKDCLATWFVYDKYKAIVTDQKLLQPYNTIFQPSIKVMLKMMLTGLPLDAKRVDEVSIELSIKYDEHFKTLRKYSEINKFNEELRIRKMLEANAQLKKKVRPVSDFTHEEFNPKSNNHIRHLMYEQLGYEPIDYTDTNQAATGAKTLKKLLNVSTHQNHTEILEHLIGIGQTSKILGTFIKAFKKHNIRGNLHGSLKLGGTQSGRLSSSDPNLQNLPSGSLYGKAIKSCFKAPKGWLWAGADFASLEDRVNAILTKDPNKIKVYTDGYDGHCLRTFAYFKDQMPDIEDTVESINSIDTKYPKLRQKSKGPTFALTYNGTWNTLVANSGFTPKEAKQIESNYHKLYTVSDKFSNKNVKFASKNGYMKLAFGMVIKCPMLSIVVNRDPSGRNTPYAAIAEARSANNAVTQSWGMLINRALIATNDAIESSNFLYDIRPINTIHDAAYFLVRDTPEAIQFLNDTLIKEMQWNAHPSIQSKNVFMEADLEIGKSWDKQTSLPNGASLEQIKETLNTLGG